jgi:dTDP-4-amino-4,6-dideoxygalactose transaminase
MTAQTTQIETLETTTGQSVYFGNGTTALYCSLRALGCANTYVGMPAAICPSVVATVLASGNTPYFIDIERERMGPCPKALESVAGKLGAVIAVHGYGIPCKIVEIKEICRHRGIPMIEDCAQAQGATLGSQTVGAWGDIAVFSYGAGKIIEAGGGGRATTSNPELLTALEKQNRELKEEDESAAADLGSIYKFFYNRFYADQLAPYRFMFTRLFKDFGTRIVGRFSRSHWDRIQAGEAELQQNIAERRRKVALYATLLASRKELKIIPFPEGSAPWRFNIWLQKPLRDKILRTLIAERANVSSWYPSITPFLEPESYLATDLSNSNWLSDGLLNLWVDGNTSDNAIRQTCTRICELLDNE